MKVKKMLKQVQHDTRKKVVLFDIDYTLFDTEGFRDKMYQSIYATIRVSNESFKGIVEQTYEDLVKGHGYFTPRKFLNRIVKFLPVEEEVIAKAIWNTANFKGNFYEEAAGVVKALSQDALVGIFSKGYSKKWQKTKLTEIAHLLDKSHIYITIDKFATLPKLFEKYKGKKLFLVDDAIEVLHKAKAVNKNVFTIWVKRGKYALATKPSADFTPDSTVETLKDVVGLVRNN